MDTRTRILDTGEELMRRVGYSGFSYADIAREVGIRKASIHHHFPTKADLAREAVLRCREAVRATLEGVSIGPGELPQALAALSQVFESAWQSPGQGCLCGSLSGDWASLPDGVQGQVRLYWLEATDWVARVLMADDPGLELDEARPLARMVFSLFEGALMTARTLGDEGPLLASAEAALTWVRARRVAH